MSETVEKRLVRIAELEIELMHLDAYLTLLKEEIEASIRLEVGVISLYAVSIKGKPNLIRLFEIYASQSAYESHIKSKHFMNYKLGTQKMVKSLNLIETEPLLLGTKGLA